MTYEEFLMYRNKIIQRMNARNKAFPKTDRSKLTYYEIRLNEINEQYPEFSKFGVIKLKGS